ncbi:MAG: hypothetical protein ABSA45_12110, partial [Verrucomicrobiota bacterium]
DHTNGRPRGFGFVNMATSEGARAAIRALHGKEIGTHNLIVWVLVTMSAMTNFRFTIDD